MNKIVPPTKKYLDSLVEPFLANQPEGLAFVIGYVGPTFHDIYFKGNLANQFGKSVPLGKDTPFELASVSKTFTATLSAFLAAKYSVELQTETIGTYNGATGFQIGSQFNSIPLSTLLSYSSGLPADNSDAYDYPPNFPTPYSAAGMIGYLNMTDLQPGSPNIAYGYSNMGFSIIAQILPLFDASLASLSFTELMSKYVLKPLGMNDTFFFESVSIDTFPQGYSFYDSSSPYPVAPGWPFFDAWYGAGGVVSTPKDMMTWLRFNMGLIDDVKKALWDILPAVQNPATNVLAFNEYQLGLSWFISSTSDLPPGGAVWKDGEITGTNTFIEFLPWAPPPSSPDAPGSPTPSQAGVFVMTNCDSLSLGGTEVVATLANDVLITMQGQTPPADKSRYPRVFGRR
jgi:D-alanyl-D-alanine-carboxypeptidase/D-alanyl-D-alanine-endopeptidase